MSTPISVGNIRRYHHACICGRAFELDTPDQAIPDHVHNHRMVSGPTGEPGVQAHVCAGCNWTVYTYISSEEHRAAEAFIRHHTAPEAGLHDGAD